jgi:hypothetical protein
MTPPNLNDLELGNYLSVLLLQARQVTELTANRRALALAECLTKIEEAARKAQWRLLEITDDDSPSESPRPARPA